MGQPPQPVANQDKPAMNPFGPQPAEVPKLEVPNDSPPPFDISNPGPATIAADDQEAKEQQEKDKKYNECIKKCEDEKDKPKTGFFDFSWLFGTPKQAGGKRASRKKLKHKKGK